MASHAKCLWLCLLVVSGGAAHGAVWYVTPDGTGAGISWADAGSLQAVVNAAAAGDEVWVAAGTYTGSGTNVLTMKEGVDVYGGFAGNETHRDQRDWVSNETIIDGEDARRGVLGADNAVLDGFTVERGDEYLGGGMREGTAINCTFIDNSAEYGGGVWSGTAINCTFAGNTAYGGGGMRTSTAINCTFIGNTASQMGGGHNGGTAMNCTFIGNTAPVGGAIRGSTATNCIIWNNSVSTATITYSCVQGGHPGDGNISTNPLFVDAAVGDLRLQSGSPCINAGTSDGAPDHDIRGVPRPQGASIDMGAYEATTPEITLLGEPLVQLRQGDEYLDAGATASDLADGDLTAQIDVNNPVDTAIVGIYTIRYNVVNTAGFPAVEVTRTVVVYGDTLFVSPDGTGYGTSWEDAGPLQDVVDVAQAGDEVWVAAGTYTSSSTDVLTMKEGVNVYGGFVGDETERDQRDWETNETIIDGEDARRGIMGADNAVLDGFTITRGGNVYVGGGMSGGMATNCTFTGNTADEGGGIYGGTAVKCLFSSNMALYGGGMRGSTATNCTFTSNTALFDGGGMSASTATNCTFTGNAAGWGGGGGMSGGTATNCTFIENMADNNGGGMSGGTATNSIIWSNTPNAAAGATITYSCVEGGYAGDGNIDADPLFVDAAAGDLRLQFDSPCIDAGTTNGAPDQDIRGVSRPMGAGVDMGAYEMRRCAITLIGLPSLLAECGVVYYDQGATVWDDELGDITGDIITENPVDTSVPGEYTVRYNAVGSEGIPAAEVTRTVYVVDALSPVIFLLGEEAVELECGDPYQSPGVIAWDLCDGDLSAQVVIDESGLNSNEVGAYAVAYNVSDNAANAAEEETRVVNVVDTQPPVIALSGESPMFVERGNTYEDAGATAWDACDGDVSEAIEVDATDVNTDVVGVYTVTYNVRDNADNTAAEVTRAVEVYEALSAQSPEDITLAEGAYYDWHVSAIGGLGELAYQWQRLEGGAYVNLVDGPFGAGAYSGVATDTLRFDPFTADMAGTYRVEVSDADGTVYTDPAIVSLGPSIPAASVSGLLLLALLSALGGAFALRRRE